MTRGRMSNTVEMETNVITTSSTGVVTTILSLHRHSQDTSPDSLLTVSGGLSKTGALVTPDLVDSSGRDPVSSSRDEVISGGRDEAISSGRDKVMSSRRDKISSGRERISSGRASQGRV